MGVFRAGFHPAHCMIELRVGVLVMRRCNFGQNSSVRDGTWTDRTLEGGIESKRTLSRGRSPCVSIATLEHQDFIPDCRPTRATLSLDRHPWPVPNCRSQTDDDLRPRLESPKPRVGWRIGVVTAGNQRDGCSRSLELAFREFGCTQLARQECRGTTINDRDGLPRHLLRFQRQGRGSARDGRRPERLYFQLLPGLLCDFRRSPCRMVGRRRATRVRSRPSARPTPLFSS